MQGLRILVVEDEAPIRAMIAFALARGGYEVVEADCASGARHRLADHPVALLLLDWMLPDLSGLDLLRSLKGSPDTRETPIILLTARADEADKIAALESGADDYITKPFSPLELLARIQAVLRRAPGSPSAPRVEIGGLLLDQFAQRITFDDRTIQVAPSDYRLLAFLMTHPNRVFSRNQLLDQIWGSNAAVGDRAVDVHVGRLRRALEPFGCGHLIQTVRGVGYRLSERAE